MNTLSATEWLEHIEAHTEDAGDGQWLEQLVCDLGPRIPDWDLRDVFHWKHWPDLKVHFPAAEPKDRGIDNVGIRSDGSLVAIQCKARAQGSEITARELETFAQSTLRDEWVERWVVTNASFQREQSKISQMNETKALKHVDFVQPVRELALYDSVGIKDDSKMTAQQDLAVNKIVNGLLEHAKNGRTEWNDGESRGLLVMPCGTGKTRVSYRVMKSLVRPGELCVVLVPSIGLVKQIKRDFQSLARHDDLELRTLAVCSDRTAGDTSFRRKRSEDTVDLSKDPTLDTSFVHSYEVVGDTATNEDQITHWFSKHGSKDTLNTSILVVFSTYQSAHNTAASLREQKLKAKLMICDEAHRTAGIKKIPKNGERLKNFTLCHDKDKFPATYRLYQTATPRIFNFDSSNSKHKNLFDEDDSKWDVRSMSDIPTFGPEIHRLAYVQAVQDDLLSDYRIIAWGMSTQEIDEAERIANELNTYYDDSVDSSDRWDTMKAMRAMTLAAFLAGCVPAVNVKSVIAFCNRIKISKTLEQAITSKPIRRWVRDYFQRIGLNQSPSTYRVSHIDASSPSPKRDEALHDLREATQTEPYCISNVGIFGEGTDSPGLSAVAFLNPRKSPVDVIQAVGRSMRKSENKNFGYIFLPVFIPKDRDPESFLRNSSPEHGWEELAQILQALRAHDGRIEDHLVGLMEVYLPPPLPKPVKHIVVVKDRSKFKRTTVYEIETKTPAAESIVAPFSSKDKSDVEERITKDGGKVSKIADADSIVNTVPPSSISSVIVEADGKTYIKDLTDHFVSMNDSGHLTWDPTETIEGVKEFQKRETRRRERSSRLVQPRPRKPTDRQQDLGYQLLRLEGDLLAESGIHLNLLEKSGIQSGPRRDRNILRGTVNRVASILRSEDLEEVLAFELGMENVDRKSTGVADACAVTAVIWVNAAIMHARLANNQLFGLQNLPSLVDAKSSVVPARGIMKAWGNILIKDYVPIFKIARDLLEQVAFKDLECVSDALRLLAKDATEISEQYVNIGMDHAGELFNEVMGNQQSDGAFFTRPLAAIMLTELCLHSSGYTDWLDRDSWDRLRTLDPACGSGTILVAMLNAVKERIRKAGGSIDLRRKFHRKAVEQLMLGADINHVSLQLAGCQLTLDDPSVDYEKMNLHLMEYGSDRLDPNQSSVKTGTVELLLDERIVPRPEELAHLHPSVQNKRMDMKKDSILTSLGNELCESPPYFVLMNPPYTSWRDIGSKFSEEIHRALRDRLSDIWEDMGTREPFLKGKKTTIGILFEYLAMKLVKKSHGVMGFVCAATILTAEEARDLRKFLASEMHVDFVLTSHDPMNINMSWNTNINECLIVMSSMKDTSKLPTRFINIHHFPESIEEALEIVERAVLNKEFIGSSISWDYELVSQGNWSPAVFADCEIASLLHQATQECTRLRTDLIGTRNKKPVSGGGGRWHVTRFDI